jgi:hypothetical protein
MAAIWLIAIPAIISAVASLVNSLHIRKLHVIVNSRLTQLLELTAIASKAEGVKEEKEKR